MSRKRFENWESPKICHGKLTKWNWMVQYPEKLNIGKNVDIGAFTYINSKYGLNISDNVQVGSHCSIYTESTIDNKNGPVKIGENSCVGSHCTVMPGVKIGKNVLIGAHSYVNKDIPDNVIAFGVPVKIKNNEE